MKNFLEFIPFLNLYPIWAQIIVLICLVFVAVLLIFVPRNAPATKESSVMGDGGVQATTTGDNSPAIVGNATINYGHSAEDIQAMMRKVLQENPEPLQKFGPTHAVGAITPDRFVGLKGEVPSGFEAKWETGRVIHMSSEHIQIKTPQIEWNGLYIDGNIIELPKKVGAIYRFLALGDFVMVFEIIGIDQDLVTVCLAVVPK